MNVSAEAAHICTSELGCVTVGFASFLAFTAATHALENTLTTLLHTKLLPQLLRNIFFFSIFGKN